MDHTHAATTQRTWRDISIIVLAVLTLGGPTLAYPFGRDQGEYAWIAASALHGREIYRDVFNVKPPLTHLIHEAALLLFGYHMVSIRILDLFWQGATAILIFGIAKKITSNSAPPILAAILYLTLYYAAPFRTTAQTDGFINLFAATSILLFLHAREKNQLLFYILSGAAIGLAILLKYPIGILLPLLTLLLIFKMKQEGSTPILLMGIGTLLPLACGAISMLISGSLNDFLWTQFTYISKYSTMPWRELGYIDSVPLVYLLQLAYPSIGWISLCGWLGLVTYPTRPRATPIYVIVLWWIAAAIHFVVQNKFYTYHILPLYAPLAVMLAHFFMNEQKASNRIRLTLGFIGICLAAYPYLRSDFPDKYIRAWKVLGEKSSLQTIYASDVFGKYNANTDFSSSANMEVSEYIAAHAQPDEKIFIWGFEPGVYFLSQRENATRFIYNFPLYGPYAIEKLQQEFIRDLGIQKPVYILIVKNDAIPHVTATTEDSWTAYQSFTPFHDYVSDHYHFETTIEDFALYRLDQ